MLAIQYAPNDAVTMKNIALVLATNPDASVRNGRGGVRALAQQANELTQA